MIRNYDAEIVIYPPRRSTFRTARLQMKEENWIFNITLWKWSDESNCDDDGIHSSNLRRLIDGLRLENS